MALLWEALAWARRACPIFPLPNGEKKPTVSFPELATTDESKIIQMWRDPITGSKDLNIGVLCGVTFIIVDIDTKNDKKYNRSAVANYEALGGHWDTLVVKTASGGLQAYFKLPPGVTFRNMQDVVPAIDIRGFNGYGIAPGSFSLESGGAYELYIDKPMAEIPPGILAVLKPVKTRKERFNGHADAEKAIPLYVDYLQRVAPAIEGQAGDAHTYNVACMGVRDYGLTAVTVFNLLMEHFNPRCEPPWEADELQHKVENADDYAIGEVGSKDPENTLAALVYKPPLIKALAPPPLLVANGYEFQAHQPKQLTEEQFIPLVDWVIYPLCVPRTVTMAVGPGGVGKSTFFVALACHAAVGKDFGPYKIPRPIDVLLYNPEDSASEISGRAAVTCTQHGLNWDEVRQHLFIMDHESEMLTMVEADNGRNMKVPPTTEKYFTDYINAKPTIKLVIVDPLRKVLVGVNENDNAQMSLAMRFINKFAQRLDVGMIISHHTVKHLMLLKNLDPDSPDLSVGAGSVVSSARIVMNILPQTMEDIDRYGKHVTFFSTRVSKSNHGPSGPSTLQWWERRVMRASNNGLYTTPIKLDITSIQQRVNNEHISAIGDDMVERSKNAISVAEAAAILGKTAEFAQSTKSLAEAVRRIFNRGSTSHPYTDIFGNVFMMMLETEGKRHEVVLVPQSGYKIPPPATMVLPTRTLGPDPDEYDGPDEEPLPILP